MQERFDYYWLHHSSPLLRRALVISVLLHVGVVAALTWVFIHPKQKIHPSVYQVQFMADANAAEATAPVAPPPPEPEPAPPPKETPKPKPPEKPKVEKPKPPEKPKEPDKPKEKPKPPEPKPEKKPEPPKEKPKPPPEKPKEPPKEVSKETPKETPKPTETPTPAQAPVKPGVSARQALPTVLGTWGGLVQRKVERAWEVPVGVRIDPQNNEAVVSFWVNRDGRLIDEPEILKNALDPAVGQSAIAAVKAAVPFPPLPDAYTETEVQVVYTFIPQW